MTGKNAFRGIVTPLITPYADGKMDYNAVGALSDFVATNRVTGVFPGGSTGCFPFLSVGEHIELIKAFAERRGKGVKLFAGVGRNSIGETLEVAKEASRLDPFALVVVTPYYIKLDDEALYGYFDKIASSVDENIILYNIPQFTGKAISADVAKRLASAHKNVVGIKDSSGDFRSFSNFISEMPKDFMVFQGQDDLLLPSLMLGASGGVCGTTNFSDTATRIYEAYEAGRIDEAKKLQEKLNKVMKIVNSVQFPIGYNFMFYKKALGKTKTNAVPPLLPLKESEGNEIYKKIISIVKD